MKTVVIRAFDRTMPDTGTARREKTILQSWG
jgi:hypothetical protein